MGLEGTLDEGVGGVVTEALALDFLSLLADLLSSSEKKKEDKPTDFFFSNTGKLHTLTLLLKKLNSNKTNRHFTNKKKHTTYIQKIV